MPPSSTGIATTEGDPGGFRHIPQLDGIRGLAILLVMGHHYLLANSETSSRILAFFIGVRESMWVGVDIFFALSGFLITGILFDSLRSPRFLITFYGRRSLRIFPLYYLAIFVIWVAGLSHAMRWNGYQWVLLTYLENTPLWIGQSVPHPLVEIAGHLWSLALEEQFYLVWPLLVLVLRDRRRLMTTALLLAAGSLCLRCLLVLHHAPPEITYKMMPCRLDGLLIGGWLALAVRGPERERVIRAARPVFWVAAGILLCDALREHGIDWQTSRFVNSVGYTVTALAATALIALTLRQASWLASVFRHPWLRWFGRYSYGLYVWHMIVLMFLGFSLRTALNAHLHSKLLSLLGAALITAGTAIPVSVLSYHAFEAPFLRLKRYFSYREATNN